jgi:hypothetical protein
MATAQQEPFVIVATRGGGRLRREGVWHGCGEPWRAEFLGPPIPHPAPPPAPPPSGTPLPPLS